MSRVIGTDMIKKLMKSSEPKVSVVEQDDRTRWPGSVNLLKLAHAVEDGEVFVMFGNNRFNINYYDGVVLVKPSTGFAPMGWFSYQQLTDAKNKVPE